MFELISIAILVFVALIVLGLFFKGETWSPSVTIAGKKIKVTIAVPQVAFSIVDAQPAPPQAK